MSRRKGEVRRDEILRATVRELERRGFAHTRVADIAAELGVSTALVFYHFDTKEALFAAAFADAAERDVRRLDDAVARRGPGRRPAARGPAALRARSGSASGWPLWIDAWAAALREPALRRVSRRLDVHWKNAVAAVITDGVASGELTCPDPHAAAWRITAMLDGLAVQVTVHKGVVTRRELSDLGGRADRARARPAGRRSLGRLQPRVTPLGAGGWLRPASWWSVTGWSDAGRPSANGDEVGACVRPVVAPGRPAAGRGSARTSCRARRPARRSRRRGPGSGAEHEVAVRRQGVEAGLGLRPPGGRALGSDPGQEVDQPPLGGRLDVAASGCAGRPAARRSPRPT